MKQKAAEADLRDVRRRNFRFDIFYNNLSFLPSLVDRPVSRVDSRGEFEAFRLLQFDFNLFQIFSSNSNSFRFARLRLDRKSRHRASAIFRSDPVVGDLLDLVGDRLAMPVDLRRSDRSESSSSNERDEEEKIERLEKKTSTSSIRFDSHRTFSTGIRKYVADVPTALLNLAKFLQVRNNEAKRFLSNRLGILQCGNLDELGSNSFRRQ